MKILLVVLVIVTLVATVLAEDDCYLCANGRACVSEVQFVVCSGRVPLYPNTLTSCPENEVCSGGQCVSAETTEPSCRACEQCTDGQTFACLSRTKYKSCGTGVESDCVEGMECFPEAHQQCTAPTTLPMRQCLYVAPQDETEPPTGPEIPINKKYYLNVTVDVKGYLQSLLASELPQTLELLENA